MIQSIKLYLHREEKFYGLSFSEWGFIPKNRGLYTLALLHRSASRQTKSGTVLNYERLEFLGDAVLGAIVADIVYKFFPNKDEGFMTQLRSRIVSRASLNQIAIQMGLDKEVIAHADGRDVERTYPEATEQVERIIGIIRGGAPKAHDPSRLLSDFEPSCSEEQYCDMVKKAKDHIREGDIFQVVLSNRLGAEFEGSLLDVYRVLRMTNPSPYMFYLSGSDIEAAGASPETLVKLVDGELHTFPLAGTRPRGRTDEEDRMLEEELLSDEKELAEHNMLVDLGRNDIGRVSEFGSVAVERYLEIERFSHVMHIGSTVRGRIRGDKDALDAIESVLPAGTLSGAPKLMACRIIDDLEDCKRGIYGGAIGYIDLTGNMDVCIGIRLAYRRGRRVYVRSGAGIVADSVPENEYRECINKAKAVVEACRIASEGLE